MGLGHEFLRHIERTRVIIHIVDAASVEGRDPVEDIHKINKELEAYKEKFATPYQAAELGYIDEIIYPRQTRKRLIQALEMTENKMQTNPPKKHGNMPL